MAQLTSCLRSYFSHYHARQAGYLLGLCLFVLFSALPASAQLLGKVSDKQGTPLPFATVHIKGTTQGVSANVEGNYQLELAPGKYDVVFQYIGYASQTIPVTMGLSPQRLDATLEEAGIELAAIEVLSGTEDPAYPIIREAIKRRDVHCDQIRGYQCRAYIKGGVRIVSMPDTLFGSDVREMIGDDSTGFLYLSESEADIAIQKPDQRKEVMIASKVSGNANGFSFNRFGILDFCKNTVDIGRPLVNPIADNALNYYKYRLLQTYHDQEGIEIHKIEVKPRRSEDPAFYGTIYILGEQFRYHSLDLLAVAGNTKIDVIDTFGVQQTFLRIEGDYWPLFQQTLRFQAGLLGFKFGGNFTAVTSNYVINPIYPPGYFTREIMKVDKLANEKDSLYWAFNRPIPLTLDEVGDYTRKDSLSEKRESRPYLDSLDRVMNKFKAGNLLTGYTLRRTFDKWSGHIGPATAWFNAVQGWTLGAEMRYQKEWRDQPGRSLSLKSKYIYGFSDEGHRFSFSGRWQGNAVDRRFIQWKAGNEVRDLNGVNTFPIIYDAYLLLLDKSSVNRYYQSRFAQLQIGKEVGIGWTTALELGIDDRRPAVNTTEYSFKDIDRMHPANDDLGNPALSARLGAHTQFFWTYSLSCQPGMRFISYPNQRFMTGSKYPRLEIIYRGGTAVSNHSSDVHLVRFQIAKKEQIRSIYGSWSYLAEAGHFLKSPVFYHDYYHFTGNAVLATKEQSRLEGFRALPVYAWSTGTTFLMALQEWDDNSYVFDKIPGVPV
jgi:hypothetical protein